MSSSCGGRDRQAPMICNFSMQKLFGKGEPNSRSILYQLPNGHDAPFGLVLFGWERTQRTLGEHPKNSREHRVARKGSIKRAAKQAAYLAADCAGLKNREPALDLPPQPRSPAKQNCLDPCSSHRMVASWDHQSLNQLSSPTITR